MGYMLRRMIRDGAPSEWSPLMRLVASEIADDARDPEGESLPAAAAWPSPWSAMPIEGERRRGVWVDGLAEICGMSARAVSRVLAELAGQGYDMRAPITDRGGKPVRDKRGRLVYAAKGHAVRFAVPFLPPRGESHSSPEVASYDGERLPDSATIETQRSPLLVSMVATSGDPVPSASPNVKTVPLAAAARPAQDQGQKLSVAKSQRPRLPDGPETVADDAQPFPPDTSESPATDRYAREGGGPDGLGSLREAS